MARFQTVHITDGITSHPAGSLIDVIDRDMRVAILVATGRTKWMNFQAEMRHKCRDVCTPAPHISAPNLTYPISISGTPWRTHWWHQPQRAPQHACGAASSGTSASILRGHLSVECRAPSDATLPLCLLSPS